jgi:hypothetical protein
MDRLPQELIERIFSFLLKADLRNLLTLSSSFRYAAERCSGAFAEYTIDEGNSARFLTLFSGHRLLYLRDVNFTPSFPPIHSVIDEDGYEVMPCRDTEEEIREKDESFTRQIVHLFTTLKSVEEQAGDQHAPGNYLLSIHAPTRDLISQTEIRCQHRVHTSWRIHLLDSTQLQQIASVRSFELRTVDYSCAWTDDTQMSKLNYRILIDLATKFPNLEFLGCHTGGFEWHSLTLSAQDEPGDLFAHYLHDWEGPRRDARHDFAKAVTCNIDQLPKSLKRASLDFLAPFERTTDITHNRSLPDLVSPASSDPFTLSLRLLSNNLRQLQIRAMIDASLFWPDDTAGPLWPNLEKFELVFHIARPDGTWYFQGPTGEGSDAVGFKVTDASYPPYEMSDLDAEMDDFREENGVRHHNGNDTFRIAPHPNLRPLLEGFAKVAIQMRALKEASIWTGFQYNQDDDEWCGQYTRCDLAWGITYGEPGLHRLYRPPSGTSRTLEWMTAHWRPDPELHALFQQIGREKYGGGVEELWPEDARSFGAAVIGKGFVFLENFKDWMFGNEFGKIPLSS